MRIALYINLLEVDLENGTTMTRHQEGRVMQAITVSDRDAGVAGLSLTDLPYPQAADNEVVVRVYAAGFTPGELD